jgi:hypothetical protein
MEFVSTSTDAGRSFFIQGHKPKLRKANV